eukprot:s1139_g29.t1
MSVVLVDERRRRGGCRRVQAIARQCAWADTRAAAVTSAQRCFSVNAECWRYSGLVSAAVATVRRCAPGRVMTKLPEASDGCASHYRGSHSANWRGAASFDSVLLLGWMAEAEMPPASGSQEHSRGDYAAGRGCKSGLMHGACQVPAALVQRCLGFGGLGRAARTDLECHICRFSPPLARPGSPEHVKHGTSIGRLRAALHAIDWSYIMRGDAAGCASWAAP